MAIITDKKHFMLGFGMAISFMVILVIMFMPVFGGYNAFEASDRLFNSISKGSIYYMPDLSTKAEGFRGQQVTLTIKENNEQYASYARTLLTKNGMEVSGDSGELTVKGDLGALLVGVVGDADLMFYNQGEKLEARYGIPPKIAMYEWWRVMREATRDLKKQKNFKMAATTEEIIAKGVELGYNYYGIEPEKASTKWGILTFSLVFYVAYTLWWGFAIFFISEGVGLQMKKGAKKEV